MPDKRAGITHGQRFYNPATSDRRVQELRAIDKQIHEESVADFARANHIRIEHVEYAIPAIRAWNISPDHKLQSLAFPVEWDGPVTRNEKTPSKRGVCGYWAVKPHGFDIICRYDPCVIGFVELSGTVVEHDHGWRGEICVIRELFIDHTNVNYRFNRDRSYGAPPKVNLNTLANRLEQLYQCDVRVTYSYAEIQRRIQ